LAIGTKHWFGVKVNKNEKWKTLLQNEVIYGRNSLAGDTCLSAASFFKMKCLDLCVFGISTGFFHSAKNYPHELLTLWIRMVKN